MDKPNILLIMSDQHRADCIGCYGNSIVKTPNIDKIAARGIRFDNAFTPLPSCCPARQSMLTGKRPETLGALWNYDISLKVMYIKPTERTWSAELKKAGYSTGYVGKWHVSPEHTPLYFGYDHFVGERDYARFCRTLGESYLEPAGATNVNNLETFLGKTDPLPVHFTRTHYLAEKACEMIRKFTADGQQWHIHLDFPEPHLPCRPSEKFSGMYKPETIEPWGSFSENFECKPYIQKQQLYNWGIQDFGWGDWAPVVSRYYGIISQMDDAIGMVVNELEKTGNLDNTLIIFTSDHGDMCGAHRMLDKHYIMYDDVTRVPLIMSWPGHQRMEEKAAGMVNRDFVYNSLDVAATIYDIIGLDNAGSPDNGSIPHGNSLLGIIEGDRNYPGSDEGSINGVINRKHIVSTYNGQQFGLYTSRMIRTGKWKYIWNTTDIDELYDLENDPYELNNKIKNPECEEVLVQLRKMLYEELVGFGDGLVRSYWLRDQLLNNRKLA